MSGKEMEVLNVAIIGAGFMGRSHSNAWRQVGPFFDPPIVPLMYKVCALEADKPEEFAKKWGWQTASTDWEQAVSDAHVGLVDVVVPNWLHAPVAIAALAADKHVLCEKPLAHTLEDARDMFQAAKEAKGKTFVMFNYRRCPAVALAHRLVKEGRLGTIRHVRAAYDQDWADDSIPLVWRFKKNLAGSGAHGDLNAHIIDITRFVTGQEITMIDGAVAKTFIKRRKLPGGAAGGAIADSGGATGRAKADVDSVTVDDTVQFLAEFSGGAVGNFGATRQATGYQNRNTFEIHGTKGGIGFNFERMNELRYYDATLPRHVQGWSTIMCTHGEDHSYVANWWPDAHLIGYEHGFTNQVADVLQVLAGQEPTVPIPDFEDAYQTQRVLEAVLISARERRAVPLDTVK